MNINITTDYIRLDALLKLAGIVSTGGQAKWLIQENQVFVNDETCSMRGKKIRPGDIVKFKNETIEVTAE